RAGRAARLLADDGVASVVVDCEAGPVRLGLAGALAHELRATPVTLDELRADSMTALVRDARGTNTARTVRETRTVRDTRTVSVRGTWRAA
ncbi:MAG: magnesium chelatase, partial [Streptomyces sp.]|nr:magnesium chelatase [Streptomyces sp.]